MAPSLCSYVGKINVFKVFITLGKENLISKEQHQFKIPTCKKY